MIRLVVPTLMTALLCTTATRAELKISNQPTENMHCRRVVCTPTSASANLNIGDIVAMLNAHDLKVSTGGMTPDIHVADALSWTSPNKLALDATHGAIKLDAPVIDEGDGSLELHRDVMSCSAKGRIAIWNTSSILKINDLRAHLSSTLAELAANVQEDGPQAFVDDYDAGPDGVYPAPPVPSLRDEFDGLCNTISNLRIEGPGDLGMFVSDITKPLTWPVSSIRLKNVRVRSTGSALFVGGIVGFTTATITNVVVAGHVFGGTGARVGLVAGDAQAAIVGARTSGTVSGRGRDGYAGGLVGVYEGQAQIVNASSSAKVTGARNWHAGGLVGDVFALHGIESSFATGTVITGEDGDAGGIAGFNSGTLENLYATGTVQGGVDSQVGGLVGHTDADVRTSYATGAVASGSGNAVGGLIGFRNDGAALSDNYWDIETSGQSHGVGNDTAATGVTGLTTAEFQSGLPAGFDPAVWGQDAAVNNGFPYLLAVAP